MLKKQRKEQQYSSRGQGWLQFGGGDLPGEKPETDCPTCSIMGRQHMQN